MIALEGLRYVAVGFLVAAATLSLIVLVLQRVAGPPTTAPRTAPSHVPARAVACAPSAPAGTLVRRALLAGFGLVFLLGTERWAMWLGAMLCFGLALAATLRDAVAFAMGEESP